MITNNKKQIIIKEKLQLHHKESEFNNSRDSNTNDVGQVRILYFLRVEGKQFFRLGFFYGPA
jgi:hypothetical protein